MAAKVVAADALGKSPSPKKTLATTQPKAVGGQAAQHAQKKGGVAGKDLSKSAAKKKLFQEEDEGENSSAALALAGPASSLPAAPAKKAEAPSTPSLSPRTTTKAASTTAKTATATTTGAAAAAAGTTLSASTSAEPVSALPAKEGSRGKTKKTSSTVVDPTLAPAPLLLPAGAAGAAAAAAAATGKGKPTAKPAAPKKKAPSSTTSKATKSSSKSSSQLAGGAVSGTTTTTTTTTTTASVSVRQSDIRDHFPHVRASARQQGLLLQKQQEEEVLQRLRTNDEPGMKIVDIEGKGKGVLAAQAFGRGDYVCEYAGDLISVTEARAREEKYTAAGQEMWYMYYFKCNDRSWCVDATQSGRIGRLINHSRSSPNLRTRLYSVDGTPRLGLVAIRDIREGEELLYDYGEREAEALKAHPWLKK